MSEIRQLKIREPRTLFSWAAGWKTLGPEISRRLWLLESDSLCTQARRRTRLEDFGDPPIEPALGILLNSLELEADLHALGRLFMRIHLQELLETRLRLTQAWSSRLAAMEASTIQRPIFITGMPRSGSTFLHELLAEDPENRAPRVWEVMFPIPIGTRAATKADPRVRKAEFSLWCFRLLAPRADSVYPMRAWTPHECVAIHSYTLLSEEFVSTSYVPTYEAFLHRADLGPTYAWQRRFLQYLQLGCAEKRWILKSPDHVYSLDKLLAVFPDALVIRTHRNPVEVVKSQLQLTQVLEGLYSRPCRPDKLAMREVRKIGEISDQITRFQDKHPQKPGQFVDVTYSELVTDPLAVVRRIYDRLNARLTWAVAEKMQRLASKRSRYQRSGESSTCADFRIDYAAETPRFEEYCSRFGISFQKVT
jgi:Sulfotransferase family